MDDKTVIRMRGTTALDVPDLPGTIHPFRTEKSLLHSFVSEITGVFQQRKAKKICAYGLMNCVCTVILLFWCSNTDSMALTAYTYLTIFDIFSLLTCLVSIWVSQQKPVPLYSFGYERFEVLAVFSSTLLAQLGSLFIIKESIERMVVQPEIHTGRLLMGTTLAFLSHMIMTYSLDSKAFNHVIAASSSSWLQEHVTDISESICSVLPGLSKLLLPRINPFALIAFAGASALVLTHILIDVENYYAADTWAAVWIAMMTVGTMFPMSVYSGKILLQTTPSHIIGQLDKCLREASTLDGVLEFRHEHFWILGFGKMAGSVHVRIRRDADEQMVLAHVYNRLSNLVTILTVQIFKDDWARPSSYQLLNDPSILSKLPAPPPAVAAGRAPSPDGNLYGIGAAKSNSPHNALQKSVAFGGVPSSLPPPIQPRSLTAPSDRTKPISLLSSSGSIPAVSRSGVAEYLPRLQQFNTRDSNPQYAATSAQNPPAKWNSLPSNTGAQINSAMLHLNSVSSNNVPSAVTRATAASASAPPNVKYAVNAITSASSSSSSSSSSSPSSVVSNNGPPVRSKVYNVSSQ